MKKVILAILVSLLLVLSVPATTLAAPARPMTGQLYVVAVARDLTTVFQGTTLSVTGTVTYQGIVIDATRGAKDKDWERLIGAGVMAVEDVDYVTDLYGNVLSGSVEGTLTIKGDNHAKLTFDYQAIVSGNIFVGPAGDTGTWHVVDADGPYTTLKRGSGAWNASVVLTTIDGQTTFAGFASVVGTY